MQKPVPPEAEVPAAQAGVFSIVVALSFAHLLNDMMQSLLPAIYPIIKDAYGLDFGQIGLITLAFQLTASLLQPVVGMYTDRRPQPYSLVAGMGATLVGLVILAYAGSYPMLLLGAALIGMGSSVFHPESTRMARWHRAGAMALRSRCSRSAGRPDSRSGRCWRPSSSCRAGRRASPGSRWWRCLPWCCCCGWGAGTSSSRLRP